MYFGHSSIKEVQLEQTLLPGLDYSFSWIAKAFLQQLEDSVLSH